MQYYLVTYTVKPGTGEKFYQELIDTKVIEQTLENPGCIRYDFYIPMEDENTVYLTEFWENDEALKVHQAQPYRKTHAEIKAKYCLNVEVKQCKFYRH